MGAAKFAVLLTVLVVGFDLQSSTNSFSGVAATTIGNITVNKTHTPKTFGPLPCVNNESTAVALRALDSKGNELQAPLSPNATINSTATLSIKSVAVETLLVPGPVGNETQVTNKCNKRSAPDKHNSTSVLTRKCKPTQPPPCRKVCKKPSPPQEFLSDNENESNICKANASTLIGPAPEQNSSAGQNASNELSLPGTGGSTRPHADDECAISEVEDTTIMASCASCSARANEKGVGVTLTCFECHHIPADRTCHYSKYDPRFKVSTKFFEFSEYGGRSNASYVAVQDNATTPTEDKKQLKKV